MRKNIFNKKRYALLIMMITTLLTFGGCGSKKDNTTTEEIVSESETETTEELTTESTEAMKPEKEIIEISADEYYVDYPLSLEDGRQVYVKIVPSLGFYPEKEHPAVGTNLAAYTEMKKLVTTLHEHADRGIGETSASVVYRMDKDYSFINYCIEGEVSGFTYAVSEPENWDSGIVAYRVDSDYGAGYVLTDYVLYYPLEDGSLVELYISGFLGAYDTSGDGELSEKHEEILNFYRTEEDLFIVVDPETTDVVSVE